MVAIFERPGISSNPRLARLLIREWVKTGERIGFNNMEPVHRNAIKRIRAVVPVRCLDCITKEQAEKIIRENFSKSVAELKDADI